MLRLFLGGPRDGQWLETEGRPFWEFVQANETEVTPLHEIDPNHIPSFTKVVYKRVCILLGRREHTFIYVPVDWTPEKIDAELLGTEIQELLSGKQNTTPSMPLEL